jgi:UDP-glucuronate 4-epimerase
MAYWLFTEAILAGRPIDVFNFGEMRRDFTYIDDVVPTLIATADKAPRTEGTAVPHRIYNVGGEHSESLMDLIGCVERALGMKAETKLLPMQAGDVAETRADVDAIKRDIGFEPKTRIETGIARFVEWYKDYHRIP